MTTDQPKIHLGQLRQRIRYPSNRLTIGELRQRYPKSFDIPDETPFGKTEAGKELDRLLKLEDRFAMWLLLDALQRDTTTPRDSLEGDMLSRPSGEPLAEQYQKIGLASGQHAATEMLKEIERDALTLLAEAVKGRRP